MTDGGIRNSTKARTVVMMPTAAPARNVAADEGVEPFAGQEAGPGNDGFGPDAADVRLQGHVEDPDEASGIENGSHAPAEKDKLPDGAGDVVGGEKPGDRDQDEEGQGHAVRTTRRSPRWDR